MYSTNIETQDDEWHTKKYGAAPAISQMQTPFNHSQEISIRKLSVVLRDSFFKHVFLNVMNS